MGKADRQTTITQTRLASVTATSKDDVADLMAANGVELTAQGYNLFAAIPLLVQRKQDLLEGQTPADQRNLAQTAKLAAETAIIEKNYRPIEEIQLAGAKLGAAVTRLLENSGLSDDEKHEAAEEIRAAMAPFAEGED